VTCKARPARLVFGPQVLNLLLVVDLNRDPRTSDGNLDLEEPPPGGLTLTGCRLDDRHQNRMTLAIV